MKLKAVVNKVGVPGMQAVIESPEFYASVLDGVLAPHLKMKRTIGPAEFYIQESDLAVGRKDLLCEVRLSGVSMNRRRSTEAFYDARFALERLYHQTIHPFVPDGERLQLMVSIILDQPPWGEHSTLIERKGGVAVMIYGGKPLTLMSDDERPA